MSRLASLSDTPLKIGVISVLSKQQKVRQEVSSFTTPLVVEYIDGKKWRLHRAFQYHVGSRYSREVIKVSAAFVFDFASIPQFILGLFFWLLPWWAKFNKAALVHDWLYRHHLYSRAMADLIFYEAMLVAFRKHISGKVVAWLEYVAVRVFGYFSYQGGSK